MRWKSGVTAMLVALVTFPVAANRTFWFAIVPVLPALFLVNAELWRNVCPVATLSTLRDGDSVVRPLGREASPGRRAQPVCQVVGSAGR